MSVDKLLTATPRGLTTEDGPLAELVADTLQTEYARVPGLGWLHYSGEVWEEVADENVVEAVRVVLKNFLQQEIEARADAKRIASLSSLLGLTKMRNVASLLKGILEVPASEFDAQNDLLNAANCVVDLRTGAIMPHSAEYRFTKITKADYVAGTTSRYWTQALRALPVTSARWMQARLGQGLTGYPPSDDMLAVSKGSGANGKSTMFDGIRFACGSFAGIVPDRILTSREGDHPTELTTLRGLRLAFLEELPEGARFSVKRLKDIVGTESITARKIAKDNITWRVTHSLFITTNYTPRVNESDHGTWRRLALVRFPYTYRKPGQRLRSKLDRHGDPALRDRMRNSRVQKAILAWLVVGAMAWYAAERVLPPTPATVQRDTEAWRSQTDLILGFSKEQLEWNPARAVLASELLKHFNAWLAQNGHPEWAAQLFAERFGNHTLAQEHNVNKRRVRPKADVLSRPAPSSGPHYKTPSNSEDPTGPVAMWLGVAWAEEE